MSSVAPFDHREIDRLLTTTKSVRRRLDLTRPVPREIIVECIGLGNYAPNASNLQQWRWLVIDDRPTLEAVGEQYRRVTVPAVTELLDEKLSRGDEKGARISRSILYLADHMGEVPAVVIPCFNMRVEDTTPLPQISRMFGSIYPSVWSFQLALRSRGLGSVFTTAHTLDEAGMAKVLGIPDTWTQTCLIPVGYTTGGDFTPSSRRDPLEGIMWNTWDATEQPPSS